MEKYPILLALVTVLFGCATAQKSEPARAAGYTQDDRQVDLGPYRVHYGSDGTHDFLLVTKKDEPVYMKAANTFTVYADRRPFLNYASGEGDKTIAAYMIHVRDAKGDDAYTLVDENVDGVFDSKIDFGTKSIYDWKDGKWVRRK
jgi:hypothetical protein